MISICSMDHNSASIYSRYLAGLLALSLALQPSLTYGAETKKKKRKEVPVHAPAFEGQAFEGVDYFARPSEADDKQWSELLEKEANNRSEYRRQYNAISGNRLLNPDPLFTFDEIEGLNSEDTKAYLKKKWEEREQTALQKVQSTNENLVDIMVDYKNFFAENLRKIDADIESMGYERWYSERLDKNKVFYEDPKLGKMEFTSIDGEPVAKIVHKNSGVSFIIYDEDRVFRDSEHFQQYIARQHYDAGSTREHNKYRDEKGKKKKIMYGRDTLIMGIKGNAIAPDAIEVAPRVRGIKHWWKATYKHPDRKEKVMGFVSGLAQFASVLALAHMVAWVLPGYEAGSKPAMLASFTLAYGALLGIWNSFYQNWRKRGGPSIQRAKNMSISLGYYFGVYLISTGGLQQVTVTDLSIDPSQVAAFAQNALAAAGNITFESVVEAGKAAANKIGDAGLLAAAAAAHPFHNFIANNEFKNWTLWRQGIEELERRDLHNISVPVPLMVKDEESGKRKLGIKNVETPMPRRFWNRQFLYYLPVNWTKFIDQVWFTTTIGPAMSGEYPWWTPLVSMLGFWGITIGSIRHTNWMAYKNHSQAAKELKIREGSYFYYPATVLSDLGHSINQKLSKAMSKCSKLFE